MRVRFSFTYVYLSFFLCVFHDGRLPKTRSFDNLPMACEVGGSLAPNRRSSDPSLNEKWQDHRRSLELNIGVGSDGGGAPDQDGRANLQGVGHRGGWPAEEGEGLRDGEAWKAEPSEEEAELSVAVGVAEGQMENILQEASKEDAGAELQKEASINGHHLQDSMDEPEDASPLTPPLAPPTAPPPAAEPPADLPAESAEEPDRESPPPSEGEEPGEPRPPSPPQIRTMTNGHGPMAAEELDGPEDRCESPDPSQPALEAPEPGEDRVSLMESSTETLTEETATLAQPRVCPPPRPPAEEPADPPLSLRKGAAEAEPGALRTLNGGPRPGALPPAAADMAPLPNGEASEAEPRVNGERASLSRQVSAASCGSLTLHARGGFGGGVASQHRCLHGLLGRPPPSPEQPSRSHLDDDGLTLHNDVIQQRLRQMEAGHQMEVETLKRQVQELWSRLESQQLCGSLRINGDVGDEVVRTRRRSERGLAFNSLHRLARSISRTLSLALSITLYHSLSLSLSHSLTL